MELLARVFTQDHDEIGEVNVDDISDLQSWVQEHIENGNYVLIGPADDSDFVETDLW